MDTTMITFVHYCRYQPFNRQIIVQHIRPNRHAYRHQFSCRGIVLSNGIINNEIIDAQLRNCYFLPQLKWGSGEELARGHQPWCSCSCFNSKWWDNHWRSGGRHWRSLTQGHRDVPKPRPQYPTMNLFIHVHSDTHHFHLMTPKVLIIHASPWILHLYPSM